MSAGIRTLLAVIAGAVLTTGPAPAADLLEITKGPYLQNVAPDGITIMWETTKPGSSEVEYGRDVAMGDRAAAPGQSTIHEVRVAGLSSQTKYYYRVSTASGGQRTWSERTWFETAVRPETPFRFVVWGDSRSNPRQHKRTTAAIAAQKPAIAINVGDVVGSGHDYDQWGREYFDCIRPFAATTPTYIAIGNHEAQADWFDKFVSQPGNEHWFAFTYGRCRFIVLDTNRAHDPKSEQYRWLEAELRSATCRAADFRFTFFHHPPYSEQWKGLDWDGDRSVRQYIVPLLEKYGVDICFAGHAHDYERGICITDRGTIAYVVTGGGGAPLDKRHHKDWPQIEVQRSLYHFCAVDVNGKELKLRAIDPEGKVFDEFTLAASGARTDGGTAAP